jgi:hypothetical protein
LAAWKGLIYEGKDPNTFLISATRDGAHCYTADGLCLTWSAAALEPAAASWKGGVVSANHQKEKARFGEIIASEWAEPEVRMTLKVDDYMAGWIARNKEFIGVSIEANVTYNDDLEITAATGTGVTIIFPPERPACSIEEGCRVLASGNPIPNSGSRESNGVNNMPEVTASEHQKVLDEKVAVEAKLAAKEAEVAASAKRIADLESKVKEQADIIASYIEKEKVEIMASLNAAMGEEAAKAFADKPICQLRDIAAVAAAIAKKAPEAPEGSGATAMPRSESAAAAVAEAAYPVKAAEAEAARLEKIYKEQFEPALSKE